MADDAPSAAEGMDEMLPMANIGRIIKRVLPPQAKISKDSKEAIQVRSGCFELGAGCWRIRRGISKLRSPED
jgi:hypothetical protein